MKAITTCPAAPVTTRAAEQDMEMRRVFDAALLHSKLSSRHRYEFMHVCCMLARPLTSETPPLFKLSSPLDFEIGATLSLPPFRIFNRRHKKRSSLTLPPPPVQSALPPLPLSHISIQSSSGGGTRQ